MPAQPEKSRKYKTIHTGEDAVLTPQHEIIMAALLAGKSQTQAGKEAGVTARYVNDLLNRPYDGKTVSPVMLRFREEYKRRLKAQGKRLMKKSDITKESLLEELLEIAKIAKERKVHGEPDPDLTNWIKSIQERGKLLGFYIEKKEVSGKLSVADIIGSVTDEDLCEVELGELEDSYEEGK